MSPDQAPWDRSGSAPGSEDGDPTGIRALLQGLPDPGPMPADLVARIEARLAAERAHLPVPDAPEDLSRPHDAVDADDDDPTTADRSAPVIELHTRRRRHSRLLLLGAAAAGLMVTTVAVGQLFQADPDVGTAALQPSSTRSATAAEEDAGGEEGSVEEAAADNALAGASAGELESDDSAADEAPQPMSSPAAAGEILRHPHLGEIDGDLVAATERLESSEVSADLTELTAAQAESCWTPLTGDWSSRAAAPGTLEDAEVVLLVARADDGSGHAWVMPGTCRLDAAAIPVLDAPLP